MIYEQVDIKAPITQGDIFRGIPLVEVSLSTIALLDDDGCPRRTTWQDLLQEDGNDVKVTAVLPITAVPAIAISQTCDAARMEYICLCGISEFLEAMGMETPPKTPKKWQSLIRRQSRSQLRWFYLPTDPAIGFVERMAVDFRVVLRVLRTDLEAMRHLRVGRLNSEATEHFRESLAQFFRRYPYNEWYPFTREELQAYAEEQTEPVEPYPWQR